MRYKKARSLMFACATAVAGVIIFAGCKSFVPYFHARNTPDNVQMRQYWDVFAMDVAAQIKQSLENAGIHDRLPMYVETAQETPFGHTFRDLLTARLEDLGYTVAQEKSDAAFIVANSIRIICSNAGQVTDSSAGTSAMLDSLSESVTVARGSGKAEGGEPAPSARDAGEMMPRGDVPPTEVVITTGVYNDAESLVQNSDIYYVTDPGFRCGAPAPQAEEQAAGQSPKQMTEQDGTPAAEQTGQKAVGEGPATVPVEPSGISSEPAAEEVPEEILKPLPELKVKGHF